LAPLPDVDHPRSEAGGCLPPGRRAPRRRTHDRRRAPLALVPTSWTTHDVPPVPDAVTASAVATTPIRSGSAIVAVADFCNRGPSRAAQHSRPDLPAPRRAPAETGPKKLGGAPTAPRKLGGCANPTPPAEYAVLPADTVCARCGGPALTARGPPHGPRRARAASDTAITVPLRPACCSTLMSPPVRSGRERLRQRTAGRSAAPPPVRVGVRAQ